MVTCENALCLGRSAGSDSKKGRNFTIILTFPAAGQAGYPVFLHKIQPVMKEMRTARGKILGALALVVALSFYSFKPHFSTSARYTLLYDSLNLSSLDLSRDAYQQAEQGIMVNFIDEAQTGDLGFFQNEEGKITHTGIILPGKKIIHASGRVRIDTIDHYGIFNEEKKGYSHQLRVIKRIL